MTKRNPPGRPAVDGARNMRQHNVTLDDKSAAFLRRFGKGNLSAGVRAAARTLRDSTTTLPPSPVTR